MRSVNSAIDSLRPSGTFLEGMFASVTEVVASFGREILNVAEVALGVLLRDAIDFLIGQLRDLAQAVLDAGNEFQLLEIRLNSLNLPASAADIKDWSSAMATAKDLTREQLTWIQQLAAATPFDPATIANVYTMARVFGETDEQARRLTKDITDFGAGQALTNQDLTTTIQNFGQIIERGKIMGQTIRNLTRSAFLPWDDIVTRMAKDLGITKEEVIKLVSTAEGVPADVFIRAFENMVEEEPRFIGAAGRLARALVPAVQNVKEIATSIFGLNIAVPIFDVLGERVASFTDEFVTFNAQGDMIKTDKWNALVSAATNLGQALAGIVKEMLGFLPTSDQLAQGLVDAVQGLSDWVTENRTQIIQFFQNAWNNVKLIAKWIRDELLPALGSFAKWVFDHKDDILGFFQGLAKVIKDTLAPFIEKIVIPAFEKISKWVTENKELIIGFFESLGNIVSQVFSNLTGQNLEPGKGFSGFLDTVGKFMQFVIDNQDKIAAFATAIIQIAVVLEILTLAFNIVIGVLSTFAGIIASVALPLAVVVTVVAALATGIMGAIAAVGLLPAAVAIAFGLVAGVLIAHWDDMNMWADNFIAGNQRWSDQTNLIISTWVSTTLASIGQWGSNLIASISQWLETAKTTMVNAFNQMVASIRAINWFSVGVSIVQGMINGIESMIGSLIAAAVAAAQAAYRAALAAIGAHSPSTLFMNVGEDMMLGMAQGIEKFAGLASQAMVNAVTGATLPAMAVPIILQSALAQGGGNQYAYNTQNSSNYNLNIQTSAGVEPIIQDFGMLKSMQGG